MAKEETTKRYLELQMEELKATYGEEQETPTPEKSKKNQDKNAEIAKLYEDAAEYEEDLKGFEEELEVVNANSLENIATELTQQFPDEDRNYMEELNSILQTGWKYFIEVQKTHPKEQLLLIEKTSFPHILEVLNKNYPDYNGDFEEEIRTLLVKRWENLIAIKKEHIEQELAEIKTSGLKPKYVKRVYQKFHGLI